MFESNSVLRFFWLLAILHFSTFCVNAQLQVSFPGERSIFQRQANGSTKVSISGNYTSEIDKIEVRAVPVKAGQGTDVPWTVLEDKPKGGVYNGQLQLSGGWYTLEVRGSLSGKVVGTDQISKMGVGEVFIISGQSNAQGVDARKDFPLPPGASDDRVNYINYNNEFQSSLNDPPAAVFEQLQLQDSLHVLGPNGNTAWCWGILGDLLTKKLNVPILFINTAWSGTSIQNWLLSSQNKPTTSVYSDSYRFPAQMPYGNLRLAVQHYASQYGARAVLWMLGESDNYPVRMGFDEFRADLESVIKKLGSDTNTKLPWIISKTSRVTDGTGVSVTNPAIIDAQNAVIKELGGITFSGPDTDDLPITRVDGTHFYGVEALTVLANAWNDVLSENFLKGVNPLVSNQLPKVQVVCEAGNNSISLSLPDNFGSYVWSIEQNGNTIEQTGKSLSISAPGVYSAKVKDIYGNTLRTQQIVIQSAIKPATPSILQAGMQQICADSSMTLNVAAGSDKYRWYNEGQTNAVQTGNTLEVKQTGSFVVRSENVFGCISDNSSPASIIVQSQIAKPVIAKIGPFDIALTSSNTDRNTSFVWKRDQEILTATKDTIQTDMPGVYSAKIAQTFTMEGNSLTCYSPASDELLVGSNQVSELVIFPNPVYGGEVYIESKEEIQQADIAVYDSFGRVLILLKQDLERRAKVPLHHLGPGKYIVRIKTATMDVKKQIIVR
ncbi:T9SS type A sorting domain-containing protein [Dyadobacter pollutisoli]|uniref:T9SS type A sorting domain-containing protein n=1 Tax=Dyadobacter pollutisoli TaxID=2910158 RepID=A0A9E8SNA0_9BACT|nr:T9SS type A sorting domain-containing protein [Dyadobacter pollutisoli]WAC13546.1 T9SS type A sorting domain-containing protein [Dyadobacter pollutisoli]